MWGLGIRVLADTACTNLKLGFCQGSIGVLQSLSQASKGAYVKRFLVTFNGSLASLKLDPCWTAPLYSR